MNTCSSSFGWTRWAVFAGALGASVTLSPGAAALPLVGVSASVRGLYGSPLGDSQSVSVRTSQAGPAASTDWNPYGWGLGLRGGLTLLSIYAGASFDYFFAETTRLEGTEISGGRLQLMANLGYELGIPLLKLRPLLGVGYAQTQLESSLGFDHSSKYLVVAPGAELLVNLGVVNLSGELRYNLAKTADALVIGIGTGISF